MTTVFSYMKGPDLVISQPKDCLDNMGDWCTSHHAASGKIDAQIMYFFLINN
jgi:oligoribonuclease (3'-5' exoribonuclease)